MLQSELEATYPFLPKTAFAQLCQYIDLLLHWNKTHNLTHITEPDDIWVRHIIDSLSITPYLNGDDLLDIGTGAGLPGLVLAIAYPTKRLTLLDARAKRTAFLQTVRSRLKLTNVDIVQSRIESYTPNTQPTTLITRAFAPLVKTCELTAHLLQPGTRLLAMKASGIENEPMPERGTHQIVELTLPHSSLHRRLVLIDF